MPSDQSIKRISLVRLRSDLPLEESLERWFGEHADIVRARPGVLEYTVDVAHGAPAGEGWDAVATLRFASEEAMRLALEEPAVAKALGRTRDDFAEAVHVMLVDEHRLIPPEPSPGAS